MSEQTQRFESVRRYPRVGRQTLIRKDVPARQDRRRSKELVDRSAQSLGIGLRGDDGQYAPVHRIGQSGEEVRARGIGDRDPIRPAVHDVAEDGIALPTLQQVLQRCCQSASCTTPLRARFENRALPKALFTNQLPVEPYLQY